MGWEINTGTYAKVSFFLLFCLLLLLINVIFGRWWWYDFEEMTRRRGPNNSLWAQGVFVFFLFNLHLLSLLQNAKPATNSRVAKVDARLWVARSLVCRHYCKLFIPFGFYSYSYQLLHSATINVLKGHGKKRS
jgi:hypothetical protein